MLDTVKRAMKAKDAADRIMGYRIDEHNDKISALIFADIKDHLQADIDWFTKVKKMSSAYLITCIRATSSLEISQPRVSQTRDQREETQPLLCTDYHRRRGSYGRKTDADKAEEFLQSPAGYKSLGSAPFTVPCEAFHSGRSVRYEEAVTKKTRDAVDKLREDGKVLMDEYKVLVNNINDTLAACPTWAKLLVAWPDAAKYLIELEPEPKIKPLIVRNTGLEEQVKKFQPKKKTRSAA